MHDECRMREKINQSKVQGASNIKHIASILKRSSGNFISILCHLCINRGSLKALHRHFSQAKIKAPLQYFVIFLTLVLVTACTTTEPKDWQKTKQDFDSRIFKQTSWSQRDNQQEEAVENLHDVSLLKWVEATGDKNLEHYISLIFKQNFQLEQAFANLKSSRLSIDISLSDRLPQFNYQLSASERESKSPTSKGVVTQNTSSYGLSLSSQWEIDIWGSLSNKESASLASYLSDEQLVFAQSLSVAGNFIKNWIQAIASKKRIQLSEERITNLQDKLQQIQQNFFDAQATAIDVALAQAAILAESTKSLSESNSYQQILRNLNLLLGRSPEQTIMLKDDLPKLDYQVPAKLPRWLLVLRPDILAAEKRVDQYSHLLDYRYKQRIFPSLSLSASIGTSGPESQNMFNPDYSLWNILLNLSAPIVYADSLKAIEFQAEQNLKAEIAEYKSTVLDAIREIENAASYFDFYRQSLKNTREIIELYKTSENLVLEQYLSGLNSWSNYLDRQNTTYQSEIELIQLESKSLENQIDFILATGGDRCQFDVQLETISCDFQKF